MIIVTGGSGFIGSNFIHEWLASENNDVINIDLLTYAGNPLNLKSVENNPKYHFSKGNITDRAFIKKTLEQFQPKAIVHFAAESHVDRSISGPKDFIDTNIIGTFTLLEETRYYLSQLSEKNQKSFRFLHISTDEVYGSLEKNDPMFSEETSYKPNSPYSASKAASDHLVRAWRHTYNLPVLTTNCSNNYGPYQLPEKLIPLTITKILSGKKIPIYGNGENIRDWLYVRDHCRGIITVLKKGKLGETYNIGGWNEIKNIDIVNTICEIMDKLSPANNKESYKKLITFVQDRPGHDKRYAIDASKIKNELDWKPSETFSSGIEKTIKWYLENNNWLDAIKNNTYQT